MNLRSLANAATQTINPNIALTVYVSNGTYTINPATLRQEPVFTTYEAYGNVQALDGDDLGQMDYLNIQGTIRAVYIYGNVSGVIRPDSISSAQLEFFSNESGIVKNRKWNVFKVIEAWPDWCKVAVVYSDEIDT